MTFYKIVYFFLGVYVCVVGDEVANDFSVLSIKEPEVVAFPTEFAEDQNTIKELEVVAFPTEHQNTYIMVNMTTILVTCQYTNNFPFSRLV